MSSLILDPVTLPGEGEYNLNILKEVKVTDSFMELDEDVRECQNQEHYIDCTTNKIIEEMRQQCGCLPLSIRSSRFQVNISHVRRTEMMFNKLVKG